MIKKNKSLLGLIFSVAIISLTLSGCSMFNNFKLNLKETTVGLPYHIETYDFTGHRIDSITAKSAYIHTDSSMSKTDDNGNQQSSVIDVDYGNKRMIHVGATLIAYTGLKNYMSDFNKHNKIDDNDRSFTFATKIYRDYKNDWTGEKRIVFIKSQSGYPIAVFVGKKVSINQTSMKNATNFTIDGQRLFVYRCDYTVYPVSSLK